MVYAKVIASCLVVDVKVNFDCFC